MNSRVVLRLTPRQHAAIRRDLRLAYVNPAPPAERASVAALLLVWGAAVVGGGAVLWLLVGWFWSALGLGR